MKRPKESEKDGLPLKLVVNTARLPPDGDWFEGELAPAALDVEEDELLHIGGPLRYRVQVVPAGDEILVRGVVSQAFRCVCSRCADPFTLEVREPDLTASFPHAECGDFLDLTPELREAILLALPSYPICKEECLGLCVACGANLNKDPKACTCTPETRKEQWAVLDQLGL